MADENEDAVAAFTKMKYKGDEVNITVFVPQKAFPDCDNYICKFSVKGREIEYSGKSVGFDSMQSLILSLQKIGYFLKNSEDLDDSLIEWEGGPMKFPSFDDK